MHVSTAFAEFRRPGTQQQDWSGARTRTAGSAKGKKQSAKREKHAHDVASNIVGTADQMLNSVVLCQAFHMSYFAGRRKRAEERKKHWRKLPGTQHCFDCNQLLKNFFRSCAWGRAWVCPPLLDNLVYEVFFSEGLQSCSRAYPFPPTSQTYECLLVRPTFSYGSPPGGEGTFVFSTSLRTRSVVPVGWLRQSKKTLLLRGTFEVVSQSVLQYFVWALYCSLAGFKKIVWQWKTGTFKP